MRTTIVVVVIVVEVVEVVVRTGRGASTGRRTGATTETTTETTTRTSAGTRATGERIGAGLGEVIFSELGVDLLVIHRFDGAFRKDGIDEADSVLDEELGEPFEDELGLVAMLDEVTETEIVAFCGRAIGVEVISDIEPLVFNNFVDALRVVDDILALGLQKIIPIHELRVVIEFLVLGELDGGGGGSGTCCSGGVVGELGETTLGSLEFLLGVKEFVGVAGGGGVDRIDVGVGTSDGDDVDVINDVDIVELVGEKLDVAVTSARAMETETTILFEKGTDVPLIVDEDHDAAADEATGRVGEQFRCVFALNEGTTVTNDVGGVDCHENIKLGRSDVIGLEVVKSSEDLLSLTLLFFGALLLSSHGGGHDYLFLFLFLKL